MSDIINYGESLTLDKKVSIAQTKSQGGIRVAQKRGPTLYNLEVDIPTQRLNGDTYFAIEEEIIKLGYGAHTFNGASVSGVLPTAMTTPRGTWGNSPVVLGSNQTGNSITAFTGAAAAVTGYGKALDYVQFLGSTKVYQLTQDADADASGNITLHLNSPLVSSPVNSSSIVFGTSVDFNFALLDKPTSQHLPGLLVQYGTFVFEEVIE